MTSKVELLEKISALAKEARTNLNYYHLAAIVLKYTPDNQEEVDAIEKGLTSLTNRNKVYTSAAKALLTAWNNPYAPYVLKVHRKIVASWLENYIYLIEGDRPTAAVFKERLESISFKVTTGDSNHPSVSFLYDYLLTNGPTPQYIFGAVIEGFELLKSRERALDEVIMRQWKVYVDR